MSDKKMTAVSWLIDTMSRSAGMEQPEIEKVFQQAKAMEREQIEEAYLTGQTESKGDGYIGPLCSGREYYNEKYEP